ncbi:DedA family protein [Candidatus Chloroploca asiatica]|uniref:DedA family protein n=1 Tax=Candidatus Chloroploca asiatica TaxID=1506545 RepID=A0A2H3KI59_9CHLR|nr:hypothetical protein [Candidatus Chloroploca asiatica]PDV96788.1 hypothetical protein A9Q02_06085 [Candidatus Chloroploca asiatica]
MPMSRFLLFTTLGSLVWTSALTVGGMLLGLAWTQMIAFVEVYQHLVLVAVGIGLVSFVAMRLPGHLRRRGRSVPEWMRRCRGDARTRPCSYK